MAAKEKDTLLADSLQNALEQKRREYELLLCLGKAIAGARTRDDLRHVVTAQLLDVFGASYYTLCLINDDEKTHSPFLHSEEKTIRSRTGESPIIHHNHPIEDGIFNKALASADPLVLSLDHLVRQRDTPPYIYHWYNAGITEMMLVNVRNGNQQKGLLYLYAKEHGAFKETQFNLAMGISDQLGTGICNILANEKVEAQIEEIKKYKQKLELENTYLKEEQQQTGKSAEVVGSSTEMQHVYKLISRVAGADSTVLILGETGTGKELIARAIHEASPRKGKLMIKVNCAAMPAALMESELFGHEKGSFTGATDRRTGKFELANNSTLFLDEIGELPLELQSKLLRVLQEKEFERIGGNGSIKVNVRIITATNRNLEKEVQAGKFRSDLYYRLNVFPIALPPLRKRKEDIPSLVSHFIEKYGRNAGKNINNVSHKALESLMGYSWPGNIRELEHLIERTVLLTSANSIKQFDLPAGSKASHLLTDEEFNIRPLEEIERDYILKALRLCNGRVSGINGAAIKLGMPSTTLISKMQKLGIKKEHFAEG